MSLPVRGAGPKGFRHGGGLVTKSVLLPGQSGRVYALLRPSLPLATELVVNQQLHVGEVAVVIRNHDGTERARVTYDRETVETLGALWADRAAADVQALLTPAGGP